MPVADGRLPERAALEAQSERFAGGETKAAALLNTAGTRGEGVRMLRRYADLRVGRISRVLRLARIGEITPAFAARTIRADVSRQAQTTRMTADVDERMSAHLLTRREHAAGLVHRVATSERYSSRMRAAALASYGAFLQSGARWVIGPALAPLPPPGRPSDTGFGADAEKPTPPDTSPNWYRSHGGAGGAPLSR